jgi:hypothetical protein
MADNSMILDQIIAYLHGRNVTVDDKSRVQIKEWIVTGFLSDDSAYPDLKTVTSAFAENETFAIEVHSAFSTVREKLYWEQKFFDSLRSLHTVDDKSKAIITEWIEGFSTSGTFPDEETVLSTFP